MREERRKNSDGARVLGTVSDKTRSIHPKVDHKGKSDACKERTIREKGHKSIYEIVEGWSIPCHT